MRLRHLSCRHSTHIICSRSLRLNPRMTTATKPSSSISTRLSPSPSLSPRWRSRPSLSPRWRLRPRWRSPRAGGRNQSWCPYQEAGHAHGSRTRRPSRHWRSEDSHDHGRDQGFATRLERGRGARRPLGLSEDRDPGDERGHSPRRGYRQHSAQTFR